MKWRNPLNLLTHKKPDVVFLETSKSEVAIEPLQTKASTGRVVKTTGKPEYRLPVARTGGRVVHTMPKNLRKLKEHAEDEEM